MKNLTLSVLQLNTFVKQIVDSEEFLWNISVFGEVSNFKLSGANAYFDLKEENAQISCVIFGCDKYLTNGDRVCVTGRLNFHIKLGKLSFVVSKWEKMGLGDLFLRFEILKDKLEKEGIFDQKIKKSIPKFAKKIGVATSETGAVIHDIESVARRKNPYVDIVIFPVKVQGTGAEKTIVDALNYFSKSDVDVVIVARGGGSFEDLAPFNTEEVARAIFACKKPVISAVGHETDFSISDFASDLRAPTPSVASELAVFDVLKELNNIKSVVSRIEQTVFSKYQNYTDMSRHTLDRIFRACQSVLNEKQTELDFILMKIEKTNPINILKRGFVKLEKNGITISTKKALNVGDMIDITLYDGSVSAIIENIKEKK